MGEVVRIEDYRSTQKELERRASELEKEICKRFRRHEDLCLILGLLDSHDPDAVMSIIAETYSIDISV